jgi:hypothetical protein
VTGGFLGCDWDGLVIRRSGGEQVDTLNALAVRDVAVSGATLDALLARADLPVQTAIALRRLGKEELIPLSDVARLTRTPTSGRSWGVVTELLLDGVAIAIWPRRMPIRGRCGGVAPQGSLL